MRNNNNFNPLLHLRQLFNKSYYSNKKNQSNKNNNSYNWGNNSKKIKKM